MALTTFSGPVSSLNGFIGGTATDPIAETTAGNVSEFYATTSAATGDTRLSYNRLEFTSTGSGETIRALTRVTGAGGATGGTINGAQRTIDSSVGVPQFISDQTNIANTKAISDLQTLRLEITHLTLQAEKSPDKVQQFLKEYEASDKTSKSMPFLSFRLILFLNNYVLS